MFRLMLHHNEGQSASCLQSLADYALEISKTAFARSFDSLAVFQRWAKLQPVKPDCGEAVQRGGCQPTQRSRVWPLDGMNCWEVTAHFVGVALALRPDITLHVYDVDTSDGGRHVFPAIQGPLGTGPSYEVLLQPEPPRAQSWYNTVADIAHGIGSAVLGVFGVGAIVPLVEQAWKEAPEEYGLSKNQKKPEEAPQKQPQSRDVELQTLRRKLARLVGKGTGQSPLSRTSGGGDGTRQPNPQIPPDRDTAVVEEPDDWQGTEEPSDSDAEVVDYSEGSDAEDGGVTDTDAESVDFGDGGGAGE